MKKTLLNALPLMLSAFFSIGNLVNQPIERKAAADTAQNLVTDGDFESFSLGDTNDHTIPYFPEFDHQLATLNNDNNSPAILHYNNGDPFIELRYDGSSNGTNNNIWMYFKTFAQGKGSYTIEYDIYTEGLSTSDYIGWQLLGVDSTLNLEGSNILNKTEYDALPESTIKSGWKHVSFVVDQTYKQGKNNDTLVINFYNKKNASMFCYLDNFSLKKGDLELFVSNGGYAGDFSYYYSTEIGLSETVQNGYGSFNNVSPAKITYDGSNKVCKFVYTPGYDNICTIFKFVNFPGPGKYTFEFDIKYPQTAKAYDFGMRLAGPNSEGNTDIQLFLIGKEELDNLENSTALEGYKHIKTEVFMDSFQSTNVDSFHMFYGTLGREDDWILVDNICITLKRASEIKTPSHVSDTYVDLIGNGDFENYEEGTLFTDNDDVDTGNWSTMNLDSPAQIIKEENGNHLLKLQYNGLPSFHYASTYVVIYNPRFKNHNSYRLSFDYKQDFLSTNNIGRRWHVSFLGTLAKETYKCYLNSDENLYYLSAPFNVTNGINEDIYSFEVIRKENGWCHFEMTFDTNYNFMSNVDHLRFVFDTEGSEENVVFLDNVKLDAFNQQENPFKPIYPNQESTKNPLIPTLIIGGSVIAATCVVLCIVFVIKKRKAAK